MTFFSFFSKSVFFEKLNWPTELLEAKNSVAEIPLLIKNGKAEIVNNEIKKFLKAAIKPKNQLYINQ